MARPDRPSPVGAKAGLRSCQGSAQSSAPPGLVGSVSGDGPRGLAPLAMNRRPTGLKTSRIAFQRRIRRPDGSGHRSCLLAVRAEGPDARTIATMPAQDRLGQGGPGREGKSQCVGISRAFGVNSVYGVARPAARISAMIAALIGSGSVGQAAQTAASSSSSGSRWVAFWVAVWGRIGADLSVPGGSQTRTGGIDLT